MDTYAEPVENGDARSQELVEALLQLSLKIKVL